MLAGAHVVVVPKPTQLAHIPQEEVLPVRHITERPSHAAPTEVGQITVPLVHHLAVTVGSGNIVAVPAPLLRVEGQVAQEAPLTGVMQLQGVQ